jgi:hypothetical protein
MTTNEICELDDSWIKAFEEIDDLYKEYYMEKVSYINLHCIYINQNQEIEKVIKKKHILKSPNVLSRDELLYLLKDFFPKNKYNLLSIIKCNVDIEPEKIQTFLSSTPTTSNQSQKCEFLTILPKIESIYWRETINMFQDLNDLFIFYYEKDNSEQALASASTSIKNVPPTNPNPNQTTSNNKTKKIHIQQRQTKHRKSIKKEYKYTMVL